MIALLGDLLFIGLLIPVLLFGLFAWSPHKENTCPCAGCEKKREQREQQLRRQYPPGTVVMPGADWDEWSEDTGLPTSEYDAWAARHGHWPRAQLVD